MRMVAEELGKVAWEKVEVRYPGAGPQLSCGY